MIHKSLIRLNFTSILQINTFYFVVLLSKIQIFWCEIRIFFKKSEISGFGTFISNGLISSKKCSILMVDPALNSWRSELFNAVFDVITALFPVDLSRKNLGDPLSEKMKLQLCGLRNSWTNFLPRSCWILLMKCY